MAVAVKQAVHGCRKTVGTLPAWRVVYVDEGRYVPTISARAQQQWKGEVQRAPVNYLVCRACFLLREVYVHDSTRNKFGRFLPRSDVFRVYACV